MKINSINLYNFGSYEGIKTFDTHTKEGKNIVLIGGQNGAGKTTLFTAIRLCLYGYKSLGHKSINSTYKKHIVKLINNNAKMIRPANSYVEMELSITNGRDINKYVIKRNWLLSDSLNEDFLVNKNGVDLTYEEIIDFEKYLMSIIPPELFNLYFFDGEKIADFFLDKDGNKRIKSAFLTLCGYDTFEIMRKNFKRVSTKNTSSGKFLENYINSKEFLELQKDKKTELNEILQSYENKIDLCDAGILSLENNYYNQGGITKEEWAEKISKIKDEERKREELNSTFKKWANEIIPFIMIRKNIEALKIQMDLESANAKYKNFCEVIETDEIKTLLYGNYDSIKKKASELYGSTSHDVLNLSIEQEAVLRSQIKSILNFDCDAIENNKKAIKESINKAAKIRKELNNSDASMADNYMKKRSELFEEKSRLLAEKMQIEKEFISQETLLEKAENEFLKSREILEEELKKDSINDIAARAIVMLDDLQKDLYHKQIEKVEDNFRKEIDALMRKTDFIEDIKIDDDFNIHIYKNKKFESKEIKNLMKKNTNEQIAESFGEKFLNKLIKEKGKLVNNKEIFLPVEIDKTLLSSGEKQVYIMALYYSLVQLCSAEVPFIIDTPFARIDKKHRENISKYFFNELNGQVFILSTDQEINDKHVGILKDKIAATYMLKNNDNKETHIFKGSYFGE